MARRHRSRRQHPFSAAGGCAWGEMPQPGVAWCTVAARAAALACVCAPAARTAERAIRMDTVEQCRY